ncbi:MAG: hypothetical protein ACRYFX_18985 [Janthinobacterium lividum]
MAQRPTSLLYRALVLLLLAGLCAALCYNYYQGMTERQAQRRMLERIEKAVCK